MLQMEPSVERNVPSGEPTSAEVEDVRVDPSEKPQQQYVIYLQIVEITY